MIIFIFAFISCQDDDDQIVSPPDAQTVIVSGSDLADMLNDVAQGIIECANMNYPISFNVYSTQNQTLETIIISNNEDLESFINDFINNDIYLSSINYPIVINPDGVTDINISNNNQLLAVLQDLAEECPQQFDCPDIQQNIGDDCTTPGGAAGTINGNCECVDNQIFDCPQLQLNIGDPCMIQNQQGTVNANCECEL